MAIETNATKLRSRGSLVVLVLAVFLGLAGTGCWELEAGEDATLSWPDFGGGQPDVFAGVDPGARDLGAGPDMAQHDEGPAIPTKSESVTVPAEGGVFELLSGEVKVELAAGALPTDTLLEVMRTGLMLSEEELLGYVWGPHGQPIDPVMHVTITVRAELVPDPPPDPTTLKLFYYLDGALGEPLANVSSERIGDTFVIQGDMDTLGRIVVHR